MGEREKLGKLAKNLGLGLGEDALDSYAAFIPGFMNALKAAETIPLTFNKSPYKRGPWIRPERADNPFNGWYVRATLEGAASGPLKGKRVAIKDNVMVADVPLMNGTAVLEGFMPKEDATVVTRLLDAGASILGKSTCEAYCMSCSSFLSDPAPVLNPINTARSAGGSSSGSAALLAAGEVDLAIGCDQGGSIRMPASFCGIVGMKPTHGLVPYTGIIGTDPIIDHVGPMSRTVGDNALMLEVLAGSDGIDERQRDLKVTSYTRTLGDGVKGLRIGLLKEGFGTAMSERDVDEAVRAAASVFETMGADLTEVSVPEHRTTGPLLAGLTIASNDLTFSSNGFMPGREDGLDPDFIKHQSGWRERANLLPDTIIYQMLLAEYAKAELGYAPAARSALLVRHLRAAYDLAFEGVDILLMPTTPMKASLLPGPEASLHERLTLSFGPSTNTRPFNFSHHPALSIPCGESEGLPVGMMLVGRAFEEATLYRAAAAFENR